MYEERTYRQYSKSDDLCQFRVVYGDTDLLVICDSPDLKEKAEKAVKELHMSLTKYITKHSLFETSFLPIRYDMFAPEIVRNMMKAASKMGVGPMASVAGAIAEAVGKRLLKFSKQVIIENGGDIFMKTDIPRKVAVFAGESPFSEKIALEIEPGETPIGICTSSGTVGPSFSFGSADAVVIKARSCALADAAATAIGNAIKKTKDIDAAIEKYGKLKELSGIMAIKGDRMGVIGRINVTKI